MHRQGHLFARLTVAGAVVATAALAAPQPAASTGRAGAAVVDTAATAGAVADRGANATTSTKPVKPVKSAKSKPKAKPKPKPKPRKDRCGKVTKKKNGKRWKCSFVDNFDGRRINNKKWLVVETSWSGFWMGSSCLVKDAPFVKKGKLRIVARDTGANFLCNWGLRGMHTRYTGGHLSTVERFQQTYGKYEVRLKFPKRTGPGVRGAFWLYPVDKNKYAPLPSGEIDVAEWWSHEPTLVMPSLHYPGRQQNKDSGRNCRVRNVGKFHRYTLVWLKKRMVLRIDGRKCFNRVWEPRAPLSRPQPFDHPFVLLLTFGADRRDGRNPPSDSTRLPATMVVDHVKVWR